ncbi:hypothetical protein QBC40DRAFT_287013 [Triangularia verruculosa]|uniref:BHLH domain-containing protein n=1 Tax=Triangularia verruculosa TaxID=2587418 RepID=A0AAN6XDF7_9PEZI|nr:hypothetical protein QBC40DRAFT_287013 [Triangularia verruculosa]
MDNNYYGGHYDDEDSQNLPYHGSFRIQEQGHVGALQSFPISAPHGTSISISPTASFDASGVYGDYAARGMPSHMPDTSYYATPEPASAFDATTLEISSVPQGFSFGQIQDEPEELMNHGPPLTGWDSRFQSFTPYQEDHHLVSSVDMDGNSNVLNQRPTSGKRRGDLTIETMTMNTTSAQSGSRPHKSARRSRGKRPSAPTTGLSSPTSQSTISSLGSGGSGSAAPNVFPEDYDSGQDHYPQAAAAAATGSSSSSTHKQSHNARTRHNMVEQKYRHRLNTHFDKLLEVLPSGGVAGGGMGDTYQTYGQQGGGALALRREGPSLERERKVSKAEVLDRARLYIQTLENEHVRLQREREGLRGLWEAYYERAAAMGQPGTQELGGQGQP